MAHTLNTNVAPSHFLKLFVFLFLRQLGVIFTDLQAQHSLRRPTKVLPPLKRRMCTGIFLVLLLNRIVYQERKKIRTHPFFSQQVFHGLKQQPIFPKLGGAKAQGRSKAELPRRSVCRAPPLEAAEAGADLGSEWHHLT